MSYLGQPPRTRKFGSLMTLVAGEDRVEIAWAHPLGVGAALGQLLSLVQIEIWNV